MEGWVMVILIGSERRWGVGESRIKKNLKDLFLPTEGRDGCPGCGKAVNYFTTSVCTGSVYFARRVAAAAESIVLQFLFFFLEPKKRGTRTIRLHVISHRLIHDA